MQYGRKWDVTRRELRERRTREDVHTEEVKSQIDAACEHFLAGTRSSRHVQERSPFRQRKVKAKEASSSLRILLLRAVVNEAKAAGLIRRGSWIEDDEEEPL